jgi:hypothetical protein
MKFSIQRLDSFKAAAPELDKGLNGSLTITDNMEGFLWEGSIAAGKEAQIQNKLRTGYTPMGFSVLSVSGPPTLRRGATEWTSKYVYLKNIASTSTVTAKVFFYR